MPLRDLRLLLGCMMIRVIRASGDDQCDRAIRARIFVRRQVPSTQQQHRRLCHSHSRHTILRSRHLKGSPCGDVHTRKDKLKRWFRVKEKDQNSFKKSFKPRPALLPAH